jgi:menaquinone-dependent protoporphyrinogen oxidase
MELDESSYGGEDKMSDKILVAYATAAGSTGEVAEAIGETLRDENMVVDVRRAKGVTDVSGYRAVVVGTGIRAGQVAFLETHQEALSKVPVAYFVVCMTMKDDTEENRRTVAAYLNPVREKVPRVQPVDVGLFAGVVDYSKLPLPMKLIMKAMKKPEGDFRDWEVIRAWATGVRPVLLGA